MGKSKDTGDRTVNARSSDPAAADEVVIRRRTPRAWPGLMVLVAAVAALVLPWVLDGKVSEDLDLVLGIVNFAGFALLLIAVILLARWLMIAPLAAREAPAARLGPVGIDYRVLSDTEYDMHVGWGEVTDCRVRTSKLGTPMLCFDLRDPERFIAVTTGPLREALEATHRDHGTPVAVNAKRFQTPLRAIDRLVRAATHDRVFVRP